MSQPHAAIVIVNYNGMRWLQACLASVLQTAYDDFFVIVVDNASTDGSQSFIAENFPPVKLFAESANLGFSAGNNVGIRYALERGADYVVLLNPDTRVKPSWLAELIAVGESENGLGILGAVQLRYDDDEWNSWTTTALSAEQQASLRDERSPWLALEWVEGACFAMKRAVLERVGLFDPIYFSFYEELDYCRRARYHGFETGLVKRSQIHHYRGGVWQADAQRQATRDYQCDLSQFLYALTAPDKSLPANLLNYCVTFAVKGKEALLNRRYWQLVSLSVMQFAVWGKAAQLWRKWRLDSSKMDRSNG